MMLHETVSTLIQDGYATVPVLTGRECDALIEDMWTWMSSLGTGVRRDAPSTWTKKWPGQLHGIFKNNGVGQAPFMWKARTHSKVLEVFSHLWRTTPDALLTSFDGCSVMRPRKYWSCKWELAGRLHVDLSYELDSERRRSLAQKNRLETPCVQGLIALEGMDETTGTFACIPGSHFRFRNRGRRPADWYILSDEDLEEMGPPHRVRVPKGHMVLWDSRTAHCGAKPVPSSNEDRFRYACYVSFMPRELATDVELQKRQRVFEAGRTTSHWAYPVSMNAKNLRYDRKNYTIKVPPLEAYLGDDDVALARRLVGY